MLVIVDHFQLLATARLTTLFQQTFLCELKLIGELLVLDIHSFYLGLEVVDDPLVGGHCGLFTCDTVFPHLLFVREVADLVHASEVDPAHVHFLFAVVFEALGVQRFVGGYGGLGVVRRVVHYYGFGHVRHLHEVQGEQVVSRAEWDQRLRTYVAGQGLRFIHSVHAIEVTRVMGL